MLEDNLKNGLNYDDYKLLSLQPILAAAAPVFLAWFATRVLCLRSTALVTAVAIIRICNVIFVLHVMKI